MVDTLEKTENPPELHFPTFEAWLAWSARQEEASEWVAGRVVWKQRDRDGNFMGTTYAHNRLVLFLSRVLVVWLEQHELNGRILGPEFVMRTENRPSGREPDLLYVAPDNLVKITDTYLEGAADMIIEIISAESIDQDRDDKFFEYQAAGVREYWLIEPQMQSAMFFRLDGNGHYFRVEPQLGVYVSEVLSNFSLLLDWLWLPVEPRLTEVMRFWDTRS